MKRKYIQRKKKTLFILSCIVVFMTVYSLVLPAITIDREAVDEDNGIVINDDYTTVSQEENVPDDTSVFERETDCFSNTIENTEKEAKEFNELLKEEQDKEKHIVDNVSFPAVTFSDSINDTLVHVVATEGAFPEGTIMKIEEVEEDLSDTLTDAVDNKPIESYKAIDISFFDGDKKIEPRIPIEVSITSSFIAEDQKDPLLVHIDDKGSTDLVTTKEIEDKDIQVINENEGVKDLVENIDQIDEISKDNTLSFESGSFSVYVLVYTVDFHYEVDGKFFDYSVDGGNAIALSELLDVLSVLKDSDNGKDVSDFLNDIESVSFSDESLVKILPVEQDITYEELINLYDLDIEYSSSLSNEDIDSINSKQFHEGDYALISLRPFNSEETLTIVLKDKEKLEIKVTDATDPLGINNRTYSVIIERENNGTNWHALTTSILNKENDDRGYYLQGTNFWEYGQKDGLDYCKVGSPVWKFEYVSDNHYRVSANGKYLYIDPSIETKEQTTDHTLWLVDNKGDGTENDGTLITITRDNEGNYSFSNDKGLTLCNYGNKNGINRFWLETANFPDALAYGKIKLAIPEDMTDENASHKASLISAADTQPGQKIIIYQRVLQSDDTFKYFAINGNGDLVEVYNSSDSVYWKGDLPIEWTMADLGNGYYTLYNSITGKYLVPKGDGYVVHSADDPSFNGDQKHLSISMPGKDSGAYTSRIASWDYNANITYGMNVIGTSTAPMIQSKELLDSQHFYFASRDPIVHDQLTTVDTVDSVSKGITIKMYDWGDPTGSDSAHNSRGWDSYSGNNKIQTRLDWMQMIMGNGSDSYNERTLEQGIASRVLEDTGFPNATHRDNNGNLHNLGELFDDQYLTSENANHLFLQSVYDETGFFKYSSFENYAYLGDGDDFTVYEQIGTPSTRGTQDPAHGNYNSVNDPPDYQKVFMRGNFMPYNQIDSSMKYRFNEYDPDMNPLSENDPRRNERLYFIENANPANSPNPEANANYYFGMTVEAKFTQNAGGYSENGDPMVFEFNGDDDMWVYIDNVLVLDVGGVHDAFRGRINFRTGEVKVYIAGKGTINGSDHDTTIKEMFRKAGKFPDGSDWDDSKINEYFSGDTFKDYSTHDFKMIYMERGASASNLEMMFNLPVLTRSQFRVKKNMPETNTGQSIQSQYADAIFYYKAYVKIDGEFVECNRSYLENHDLDFPKYEDGTQVVWKTDDPNETVFEIKPGQTAIFSAVDDSQEWYVEEVEPEESSRMLDNFTISNSDQDSSVEDGTKSNSDSIKNRNIVIYENKPDDKLVNALQIKKQIDGEAYNENDSFEYRIFLESTSGDLTPYSLGEYYQTDKDKNYVYYDSGERKLAIKNSDGTYTYKYKDGTTETVAAPKISEHASVNGTIGDIRDGDTIFIKGLLEGTDFYVYERTDYDYMSKDEHLIDGKYTFIGTEVSDAYTREPETNKPDYPTGHLYDKPTMNGVESYAPSQYEKEHAASGAIIQEKDAIVLVKNKVKSPNLEIKVEKMWDGIKPDEPALKQSYIVVTLGRFIATEKKGNFLIQKTINIDYGNPSEVLLSSRYYIRGEDKAGNEREYGPYLIDKDGSIAGSIVPGSYRVFEEILESDEAYDWKHSLSPIKLEINENSESDPVVFESSGSIKTGNLVVKSSMEDGGSGVSFENVTYTIFEADGVSRAKTYDGNVIEPIPFSEANTENGKVYPLKVGTYIVRESGLPEADGYIITERTPYNSQDVSVRIEQNKDSEAIFRTKYELEKSNSTYVIGKPEIWEQTQLKGSIDFPIGTRVRVSFYTTGNWDRIENIIGTIPSDQLVTYNGESLPYQCSITPDYNRFYTIEFTVQKDAVLRVYVNANPDNGEMTKPVFEKLSSINSFMKKRRIQNDGGAIEADSGPLEPIEYGDDPTNLILNYVDDVTFVGEDEKPYTLTLDQSIVWKWKKELPSTDNNGNKYYYYIKDVKEYNMPAGTSCEVLLDDNKRYIVGEDVHLDEEGNPLPLIVKNTINKYELTIKKVDKKDLNKDELSNDDLLQNAKFMLIKYASINPMQKDEAWNNAEGHGSENAGKNGVFKFSDLPPGYYVIKETAYPNGYVGLSSDPLIKIENNGAIRLLDSQGNPIEGNRTDLLRVKDDEFTIVFGNQLGTALPHTGGSGELMYKSIGLLFIASSVLLYIYKKH